MNASPTEGTRVHPEVHLLVLLALSYLFMSVIMPHEGHFDMSIWADWIVYMRQHGIRHVYELYTNRAKDQQPLFIYGPVYMYMLYFYAKWQVSIEEIRATIYQFKSVVLLFDIVGIWFALRFLPNKAHRPFYAPFLLLNVGLLYDTLGWGQNDSAIACLMLMAVYFGLQGKIGISGVCILVAFLIKPQPIVFLPAFGLLWLPAIMARPLVRTAADFLVIFLVGLLLLFPFIQAGTAIDYWTMLLHTTSLHPSVSIYAANIWEWLLVENPYKVLDQVVQYGLSYRQWGLIMFAIGYAIVLFPLLQQTYQILTGKRTDYDRWLVLLTFGLIPIVFYFFNTQIHERYAHPSILFLAAYALCKKDFIPYIVASIANFWVIEKSLFLLKTYRLYEWITLDMLAALFLFVLLWGIAILYRDGTLRKMKVYRVKETLV